MLAGYHHTVIPVHYLVAKPLELEQILYSVPDTVTLVLLIWYYNTAVDYQCLLGNTINMLPLLLASRYSLTM